MIKILLSLIIAVFSFNTLALSPEAEEGKSMIDTCNICHRQDLDPPRGPSFYSIQKIYRETASNKEQFIKMMTDFMRSPSSEPALLHEAVKQLGRHPKLGFPDASIEKIATYIYEATLEPPSF